MKESAASTCRVFYCKNTDSRVLQNASKFLIDYIMPHPRK
jgi:hypothetical protein